MNSMEKLESGGSDDQENDDYNLRYSFSSNSSGSLIEFVNTNSSYFSFPSPVSGRSPTLPSFRVPKYGYYNIEEEISPTASSPIENMITRNATTIRQSSVYRAFVQSINFFMGVSDDCVFFNL